MRGEGTVYIMSLVGSHIWHSEGRLVLGIMNLQGWAIASRDVLLYSYILWIEKSAG